MSREPALQVTPTASNEAFTSWLVERFAGDERASRVQVLQVGAGNRHGEVVFTFDSKPDVSDGKKGAAAAQARPSREKLVELSNKMLSAAQLDCDALRKPSLYAAIASDPRMGSEPYSRFLLRLAPKNSFVSVAGIVGDDEDGVLPTKLLLTLLESERRDKRWIAELMANTVSGALERDSARIEKMESILDGRLEKETRFIEATEEALSRAAERKQKAEWAAIKTAAVRDGVEMLKGLLPATVAALSDGKSGVGPAVQQFMRSLTRQQLVALVGADTLTAPTGGVLTVEQAHALRRVDEGDTGAVRELFASLSPEQFDQLRRLLTQDQLLVIGQVAEAFQQSSANNEVRAQPPAAEAPECTMVGRFLEAVESAGVGIALMGDWDTNGEGALKLVKQGVFTGDQTLTLLRVHRGSLPVAALDDLLPGSGKPLEITAEQQGRAQQIMPPAATAAIMELLAARAAANATRGRAGGGEAGDA